MPVTGRFAGGVLLSAGLVVVTLAGGAGGYGIGHLTEPRTQPTGSAAPLQPTGTPTLKLNVPVKDPAPALQKSELRYKEREFVAEKSVRSQVTVDIPKNWRMTMSAETPYEARFTDPTDKRFVRVQAGFAIERPPKTSLEIRVGQLANHPKQEDLRIVSRDVADDKRSATLVYTYVPRSTRYVMVRWVALDDSGNCAVEIGASGLIQDKAAIEALLDQASESVTRSDSSL